MSPAKKLAGFLELQGPTDGFKVNLKPWATLKGQIVDQYGDSLPRTQIMRGSVFGQPQAGIVGELPVTGSLERSLPLPPVEIMFMRNRQRRADESGRFEIVGLVPEFPYDLFALYQGDPTNGSSNDIAKQITLAPGETRDLGKVVLKKPTREQIESQSMPKPVSLAP